VSRLPFILAAIALGAVLAMQPGLNADVARRIGSPVAAGFLSILVAFLFALVYVVAMREIPSVAPVASLPWHLWLGGTIGFLFVLGALWLAPKLGASLLFAAIVAGQMIGAFVADRFGLAGYRQQPFDPWQLAGIVLVLAGVAAFQRAA
jgi:bacterial/archaeal transporter family-2 protein